MNQHDFEHRVIELWMTTRVPMTRANLLFYTKAPRKKLDVWLEAMVGEGVLDIDSDDEGEMIWTVRGATRPARGAERVEEIVKVQALSREVRGLGSLAARELAGGALRTRPGDKSVVAGGALGIFGPLGWIYSAPLGEAIGGAVVFAAFWWVLSWVPILGGLGHGLMLLASILMGMAYAWQHNRHGKATSLFSGDDRPRLPGK